MILTATIRLRPSAILVNDLCKQQESPWPFYDHHNPLTVNQLGGLLSQLGIKSMPMRLGQKLTAQLHLDEKWEKQSVRGFKRSQFETLFTSYLSGEEPETVETNTSQVNDVNF